MDLGYFLFMAEAEGVDEIVNTRTAKINAIGKELREAGYAGQTVPSYVFTELCRKHGIPAYEITQEDISYIEEEWL